MIERRGSSWWPAAAAALVVASGSISGCAVGPAPAASVAESSVPLQMPDLPPEVRLLGMEQERLQDLFGEPTVQRDEQQAQYWRYSLGRCQLDVFLYPDPATGQQEVAYFDVRPTGYEVVGADGCSDVARRFDPRWEQDRQLKGS
jgi:hypothetical protein